MQHKNGVPNSPVPKPGHRTENTPPLFRSFFLPNYWINGGGVVDWIISRVPISRMGELGKKKKKKRNSVISSSLALFCWSVLLVFTCALTGHTKGRGGPYYALQLVRASSWSRERRWSTTPLVYFKMLVTCLWYKVTCSKLEYNNLKVPFAYRNISLSLQLISLFPIFPAN